MRTTLELDDTLMEALLSRIPGATKTEAIEQALRAFLSDDAVAGLRAMAGSVEIVDVSGEMRTLKERAPIATTWSGQP